MISQDRELILDKMTDGSCRNEATIVERGEATTSAAMKKRKKLTQAESPPPAPGVIRDIPASEVPGDAYIDADVHIMFYGEEALRKKKNGERVIFVPRPGVKITIKEARERMRKRDPRLAGISRETMDKIRDEWGR
jgi:hypothetical protein